MQKPGKFCNAWLTQIILGHTNTEDVTFELHLKGWKDNWPLEVILKTGPVGGNPFWISISTLLCMFRVGAPSVFQTYASVKSLWCSLLSVYHGRHGSLGKESIAVVRKKFRNSTENYSWAFGKKYPNCSYKRNHFTRKGNAKTKQ